MKYVILIALMLALGSPAMLTRTPNHGRWVKTVRTADGTIAVYQNQTGCLLTFRGIAMQTVDLKTCTS